MAMSRLVPLLEFNLIGLSQLMWFDSNTMCF
jgi:hypothetical protein